MKPRALVASFTAFWSSLSATPQPLRAGMLNTGELVLIDGMGRAQVLSANTTDIVRDVMSAAESCTLHQLMGSGRPGPDAEAIFPRAPDPVHAVLKEARA